MPLITLADSASEQGAIFAGPDIDDAVDIAVAARIGSVVRSPFFPVKNLEPRFAQVVQSCAEMTRI